MTAFDPAVAAAQRAMPQSSRDLGYYPSRDSIRAAREALAPLRELHRPVCEFSGRTCTYGTSCPMNVCPTCADDNWPCDTARLIYDEEEL